MRAFSHTIYTDSAHACIHRTCVHGLAEYMLNLWHDSDSGPSEKSTTSLSLSTKETLPDKQYTMKAPKVLMPRCMYVH